jgi:hypothetical protein
MPGFPVCGRSIGSFVFFRALENFSDVPFDHRLGGVIVRALRRADRCAVKGNDLFLKSPGSAGAFRYDDIQRVG